MEPREPVVTARIFRMISNDLREMNGAMLLSPYAASLSLRRTGLNFLFFTIPGVPRLPSPLLRSSAEAGRRSTPGYFLPPLPGLKFRLAGARQLFAKLRFIEQTAALTVTALRKSNLSVNCFPRVRMPL